MKVNRVLDFSITPNTITSMTSSVPKNTITYQSPVVGTKRKADPIDTYVDEFNIFSAESMRELYTRVRHSQSGRFRICLPCFEKYTPTLVDEYPDTKNETIACGEENVFVYKDFVSTPVRNCTICKGIEDNVGDIINSKLSEFTW